ncbi:flagellar assembly protein FliW [Candidatus Magnetomonas plexicatena]|uniref:flagellar assembly protein FliW n=1 Tax=Candidatus Magnetomonas plexicatena TaxID=2552947 RepID=UPI001104FA28|nr:flagellar assembly protein FliW [Nitrospirales bacterium LBB_01]
MKLSTTRFGAVEVEDNRIISFPRGLIGFKDLTRYCVLPHKEPIKWLHSVDDPDVAFMVSNPFEFFPDYSFKVEDFVEEYLGCYGVENVLVFVILTVTDNKLYVNLKSPIIINTSNMKGAHLVLSDDSIPVRTLVTSPVATQQSVHC